MSMLAEPKRKTKWTLNPRGQAWAKDENKIGQKLLEKMGWQKGKGLGKSENGRTDNIKVNYKNDNNGIGFDDKSNSWITHQDDFNTILANLNKNYNDDNENVSLQNHDVEQPASQSNTKVSLEQRSRSFKSRVHYQKFVRGKDVSRYTKKDMESIFGMKLSDEKSNADNRKSETEQPRTEETKNDNFQNGNDSTENDALHNNFNGVPLFKSSSSMSDYFAEKMKKLKQQKFNLGNNCVEQEHVSATSQNDLVAFSTSENDLVVSSTVENYVFSNENDYRKKKKKSKKRKAVLLEEPTFEETTSSDSSGPVKKKRKGNSKTLGGLHIAVSPLKKNLITDCNFGLETKSLRTCFKVNLTDNVTKLMKRVTFDEIPTIFDEESARHSDYQNCSDNDISERDCYNPIDAPNSNDAGNNCVEQEDISVSSENDLVAFSTGEKDLVAISTSENDLVASSTVENDVSSNENDYRKKKKESKKRKAVLLEEPTFDETTSSDSSGPVIKKRKGNSKTLGGVHIAVSPLKKNRIANCNFDQATKSLRSCFRVNLTDNVTKLMKRVTFNEIPTIFDEKSAGDSDYQNCSDKDISEGNSYNPKDAPNSNDTGNVKNLETEPYEDECELNNKHTIEDECELNNKHTIENECELNNKHTIEDECELNNKHTIYDDDKQVLQSHTEQISDSCSFCSKKCSDSSISQKNGQPVGNDESWAVSQRLAMKMSYYKLMLKNIKKHEILSKTNILDIKGYGNW